MLKSDTQKQELLTLNTLETVIETVLGPDLIQKQQAFGQLTVTVYAGSILRVLTILRDNKNCQFRQLSDICAVDYPERPQRFEVVYHLLSLIFNTRLRVKVLTDGHMPISSVTNIYACANWYEREAWDLMGISFSEHPDLRRLLTDYNFEGHPLRKDFPLTGFYEVRYDPEVKKVVYEGVTLAQDYRTFDTISPWEGMNRPIDSRETPDGEKAAKPENPTLVLPSKTPL
jgi:NADH-quinone oxidoreductase subunit C